MHFWLMCLISTAYNIVSGEDRCNMKDMQISCTCLKEEDLYKNMCVTLSNDDVLYFNLTNSWIPQIRRNLLRRYENIHTLYLTGVRTKFVEEKAFVDLPSLRNVYLMDNYLEKFPSSAFSVVNSLRTLDLSNNLLSDLSEFNTSMFPELSVMNVSYNRLEYLPESILKRLEEENNFYLIVDNNPWNCSHPKWMPYLNSRLIEAFCTNKSYDSKSVLEKISSLKMIDASLYGYNLTSSSYGAYLKDLNRTIGEYDPKDKKVCWVKCCFTHCIFWFIGGIWLGIIIGNMCKLKRLVCPACKIKAQDKNTQADNLDLRLCTMPRPKV